MAINYEDDFRPVVTVRPKCEVPDFSDAVLFAQMRLGFQPDAKQTEILQSTAKRGILNCSRQWGKSTVTAAKAVHRAFTRPGSLVLVATPTERQSAEFLRKASWMVSQLDIKPRGDGDNAVSLLFPNGSRIVGLPGTEATVRGFSAVSLILIDEASRVPDELYMALRPMLAVGGGDLWLMSSPAGQRGFFYEAWASDEDWTRISATGTECERIGREHLEEDRRTMTRDCFAQEYLCEFTTSDSTMFDRKLVETALDHTVPELPLRR